VTFPWPAVLCLLAASAIFCGSIGLGGILLDRREPDRDTGEWRDWS